MNIFYHVLFSAFVAIVFMLGLGWILNTKIAEKALEWINNHKEATAVTIFVLLTAALYLIVYEFSKILE